MLDRQMIFAEYFARLIQFINSQKDYRCSIGEVERPQVTQDYYLKNGKTKVKTSTHQFNIAGDIRIFKLINGKWVYLTKTQDYDFAGKFWESLDKNNIWGGRFGDDPKTQEIEGWDGGHFQYGKV